MRLGEIVRTRRVYDADAVDAYVVSVRRQVASLEQQLCELRQDLGEALGRLSETDQWALDDAKAGAGPRRRWRRLDRALARGDEYFLRPSPHWDDPDFFDRLRGQTPDFGFSV